MLKHHSFWIGFKYTSLCLFLKKEDTISMQTFLMWETKDILEILYYHFNLPILIQQWFLQFYGFQFLIMV